MTNSVSYSTFNIGRFRGVDYADSELNMNVSHSPDMMNLIPYENGAVRSRNGYENVLSCDGRINGIYSLVEQKGTKVLIHHGNKLSEWREHAMYKYEVPAEGLLADYIFIANGTMYKFTHAPLQETDEFSFTLAGTVLKINDEVVDVAETSGSASGTYFLVEESSEGGVYHAKQKIKVFNIAKDRLPYGLDNFSIDSPYRGDDYVMTAYFGISASAVPAGGLTITYVDCNQMFEYTLANGETYSVRAAEKKISSLSEIVLASRKGLWFSNGEWSYRSKIPTGVCYHFAIGEDTYFFKCGGLQAGDVVKFDGDTKYLYLNDVRISMLDSANSQKLTMEQYSYPLVELSADFPDRKSVCAQMSNYLYIFTGDTAYVYGGEEQTNDEGHPTGDKVYGLSRMVDKAYVPTIRINADPITSTASSATHNRTWIDSGGGGGDGLAGANFLTDLRIEEFYVPGGGGGSSTAASYYDPGTVIYYKLPLYRSPVTKIDKIERLDTSGEWVTVNTTEYSLDAMTGIITFAKTLYGSPVSGRSNYKVTYSVTYDGGADVKKKNFPIAEAVSCETPEYCYYKRYKFYLGRDIDDLSGGLDIQLNFKADGKADGAHVIDIGNEIKEKGFDKGTAVNLSYARIKATYDGAVSYMLLPNGNYAVDSFRSKNKKKWVIPDPADPDFPEVHYDYIYYYAYWQIYAKLINEEGRIYLEVSEPYYALEYIDETVKTTTANPTGVPISKRKVIHITSVDMILAFTQYSYKDRIDRAGICCKFGASGNMDRLFVAGWDKMHEYEFWSDIDNPLYFPDTNYACLGDEDTAIMGWSRINNNQLAIHKNSNGSDPTVYIQSASISQNMAQVEDAKSGTLQLLSTFSVTFPVTEGPPGDGVISQRAFGVLCGEPLALSEKGVFATKYVADIAADVRYAVPRSYYINPKLKECDLSDAEAIVFNNRYYLSLGDGRVFVADGAQRYAVGGDSDESSFEWFPWDNVPARIWWVSDDRLYFGTADGRICRFTDGFMDIDKPVRAYWTSPWLDFGTQTYYKKIKNVVLTCTEPRTDFSEVNIDYIGKNGAKTVKSYLIDNTGHLGVIPSIATNRKAKKVTGLKVRVRSDNAEDFGIMGLSFLYIVSGKYKG